MNVLMLVFAVSFGGEAVTLALEYPTHQACEEKIGTVLQVIADRGDAAYFAAVCVTPIKGKLV